MAKSTVKGTKIKLDTSDIIIRTIGYIVVTIYALACVLPFLIILGTSFTAEDVIRIEGAQLFPKQFTTKAYEMVLQGGAIWKSYGLTITMTLTGTLVGLGIISMTIPCLISSGVTPLRWASAIAATPFSIFILTGTPS